MIFQHYLVMPLNYLCLIILTCVLYLVDTMIDDSICDCYYHNFTTIKLITPYTMWRASQFDVIMLFFYTYRLIYIINITAFSKLASPKEAENTFIFCIIF